MQQSLNNLSLEDQQEWNERLKAIGEESQALMQVVQEHGVPDEVAKAIQEDMTATLQAGMQTFFSNPQAVFETQAKLLQDQLEFWQQQWQQGWQLDRDDQQATPQDRRFKDDAWRSEPFYRAISEQYLRYSRLMEAMVDSLHGLPEKQRRSLSFYARQYVSALSPSNFLTTNPEVMRQTLESKGQNLVEGMAQLRKDLQNSAIGINVTMTDRQAFEVGKNVAITPGSVIYENELIQLIQYAPATEQVFKTPLLVVPPWINKYYILDLRPGNSMVEWLVEQGHTVFLISWRNVGPNQRTLTWADYVQMGPIAAMEAIEKACGEKSVNLLSYCVGGTLTASTLAYLTSTRRGRKVRSVTYMACLQDFRDPGELGVFVNDRVVAGIERQLERDGYLDGRVLSFVFNLLKENDLYWSFYVNNYLKGQAPSSFDLLYWNTDGTNLPGGTLGWYIRNMYKDNRLVEPNGIEIDGVKIDLRKISTPSYFISTKEDHISKWNSTYWGTQLPKGPVTFVLGGSGHIAGIVNPPHKNKYGYWTNDTLPPTPEQWFEGATPHEGSWWPHWQNWITQNGYVDTQKLVAARQPGEGELEIIEPAPGRYVRQSIQDVLKEQKAK
ncbi:class I poly(R)-hydroxyalkanoic acid synthase [Pistricoccus aurantiacus]|uniref:Class I poly(R)-hydroxyalkanoic acid synthase n=1 Tax=Pistricoccus aurantiacus TaxID=1883414 RepID=A0A5B8T041_9GAMM|nr:class I poly(R)-hydroxyalkanoic acid synthase [Pistricoccus aurantiacus]QEA40423.1 class I poly(R)-hydroxyalkanoic acid synthase [Pistricoccus aurantiacus]